MLKPAILYKDILEEKFAKLLYSEDYYFYNGYASGEPFSLKCEDGTYNYVFVDKNNNVLGFLTYQIWDLVDTVHNFGLISFKKGNSILGKDLFNKLKELLSNHHKLEWRVLGDNPVKRHYDKFCNKYNGYIHHLHDSVKNLKGEYVDSYIYEILNIKGDF